MKLSNLDMQRRYRSAFSRELIKTEEEMEADAQSEIVPEQRLIGSKREESSRRRDSISRSMITTSKSTPTSPSSRRSLHTSTFTSTLPPTADIPRHRRYSASAIESTPTTPSSETTPPPPAANRPSRRASPPTSTAVARTRAPRNERPAYATNPAAWSAEDFPSALALSRHQNIVNARQENNATRVQSAIRAYLAFPDEYTVKSHHAAIDAIVATRLPGAPIGRIVELYNQMFDHPTLKPNTRTFELVILAFCKRDREILRAIKTVENRKVKRRSAMEARGDWYFRDEATAGVTIPEEEKDLALLSQEDYFTPALKIYKALGSQADSLRVTVTNTLISSAAARQRVELALSIFSRLEKSPFDQPNAATYDILIQMFGAEKDPEGVKEVFEAYLKARTQGLSMPRGKVGEDEISYQSLSAKHGHSTTTSAYVAIPSSRGFFLQGDEVIWKSAIQALFNAEDSVGAIELIERMIAAQSQEGGVPVGYPAEVTGLSTVSIVAGFVSIGDFESARRWFDRMDNPTPNADGTVVQQPTQFYRNSFYAVSNSDDAELLSHIYRSWIARANTTTVIVSVSECAVAVDANLSVVWKSEPERANAAMDAVLDIKERFLAAVKAGKVVGVDRSFYLSSGMSARIVQALGHLARYDEAAEQYVEYVDDCLRSGIMEPSKDAYRTPIQWARVLTDDPLAGALGMKRSIDLTTQKYVFLDARRPGIAAASAIVAKARQVNAFIESDPPRYWSNVVVESYLLEKRANNNDMSQFPLSAAQWFEIVVSFASVAVDAKRGNPTPPGFPGFESIVDDFVGAGMKLDENADLMSLTRSLMQTMETNRIYAVLGVLSPAVAEKLASGAYTLKDITTPAPPTPAPTPIVMPTPRRDFDSVKAIDPSSSLSAEPMTLPTPPATPPAYFTDLPPTPARHSDLIDAALTDNLSKLIPINPLAAYDLAMSSTRTTGLYPHPEVLSRLVEALGRNGHFAKLREVYLLAYAALPSFANDPAAQSVMWVMLEDRMIIALCAVGALTEVAVHRDRLLSAGSAPSADGYAAMILNMKETTDDAAVALELFEESQRLNVAPNVFLFNTLISKLSRARRAGDALQYFEFMKQCGLRPSSITYGAIINACCKIGDDTTADFLFQEMTQSPGFKPRVPPYNTMIQFYTQTKPDREKALFYYDQLVRAGVPPTGHTYKLLLDAYGAIGTPDAQSLSEIFAQLVRDPTVAVTGAHWASLINAWGCENKDLERATAIFEEIPHHPSTINSKSALPDAVVYESLLNAFLANHRPDLCEKYLAEMKQRGIRMTAYVANTLIKVRSLPLPFSLDVI